MAIKLLTQNIINQIAAGEVIERPASVIKELVENAIDAGSSEIAVHIMDAGKSFISVSDDGSGMDKESLELCILSHATSKLDSENLFDIHTFGFRGEALPSIASISRLSITSAQKDENGETKSCRKLQMEGANIIDIAPENRTPGTTIEVRDLFFATPARLKFLKSNFSESEHCKEVFKRTAAAFPHITFKFSEDGKEKLYFPKVDSSEKRISDVFGSSFAENTFFIDIKKEKFRLYGSIGVPTYNKATANQQYFFVNNRFVKDKIFIAALRAAYSGLVPPGRYAVAVLFLEMPFNEVDVNAHPSKIEVRFKDSEAVKYFMSSELKNSLFNYGASRPSAEAVETFHVKTGIALPKNFSERYTPKYQSENYNESLKKLLTGTENIPREKYIGAGNSFSEKKIKNDFIIRRENANFENPLPKKIENENIFTDNPSENILRYNLNKNILRDNFSEDKSEIIPFPSFKNEKIPEDDPEKIYLGNALCQIHETYIIASDGENLVIVDQHAAAERITLEKLKSQGALDSQMLLMPEVISLSPSQTEIIEKNKDLLIKFGIFYDKNSDTQISVNSVPSILESCDVKSLTEDIIDELSSFGEAYSLEEKVHLTLSTISCHGSLRAGKKLSIEEMNFLLRKMEETPNIAQCCHGRPSYVKYSYKILNNFFDRH